MPRVEITFSFHVFRLRDRLHSTREALLDHRDRMKGNEALETVLDGVKDWTKFSSVLVKELEAQTAEFGGIDSLKVGKVKKNDSIKR